jgi:glycerophosphoryl diester phosphodiesterase
VTTSVEAGVMYAGMLLYVEMMSTSTAASPAAPLAGPLVVAHRGASKAERENTIAAFRTAGQMGAAMVELDVRRTSDQQLVVHHNPHVVTDSGTTWAICKLARVDLPAHVPALSEALDACEGMDVNVEIKNDPEEEDFDDSRSIADQTLALLRARSDADRMLVSSFDMATIDRVHALDPTMKTGFLYTIPLPDVATMIATVADAGHVALHPHRLAVTKDFVDAAHARQLAVNVWTVDDPDEMRKLQAMGVDAIITNVPDIAKQSLR